jgi:hypothetical protein
MLLISEYLESSQYVNLVTSVELVSEVADQRHTVTVYRVLFYVRNRFIPFRSRIRIFLIIPFCSGKTNRWLSVARGY